MVYNLRTVIIENIYSCTFFKHKNLIDRILECGKEL